MLASNVQVTAVTSAIDQIRMAMLLINQVKQDRDPYENSLLTPSHASSSDPDSGQAASFRAKDASKTGAKLGLCTELLGSAWCMAPSFPVRHDRNLSPSSDVQKNQNAAKQDRSTTLSIYTKPIFPVFGFHSGTRSNLSNSAAMWMSCC